MKIIALSMCAVLVGLAGPALADTGAGQAPDVRTAAICGTLTGSARIDCEQRQLRLSDSNRADKDAQADDAGLSIAEGTQQSIEQVATREADQSDSRATASTARERLSAALAARERVEASEADCLND